MEKERYLINEAATEVHVESHVLRYWEEELELPIGRNEQGHRIYTKADINRFIQIKDLKDQGLQLKAVKTLLNEMYSDSEGEDGMRADNPFAQKQLTKISKLGETKMVPLKSSEEIRWNERFGNRKHEEVRAAEDEPAKDTAAEDSGRSSMKNMIEIKEMRSLDEADTYAGESPVQEATKEQTMRLQYLFQKLIKEAVASNNEEMAEHLVQRISESVKGDLCKELDYQFRLMEERDEERTTGRYEQENKRNEEYYKRIDELLRQYSGKSVKLKEKNKEKNKDKTIVFPGFKDKEKEKAQKPKKEFHLFRKNVETKTVEAK